MHILPGIFNAGSKYIFSVALPAKLTYHSILGHSVVCTCPLLMGWPQGKYRTRHLNLGLISAQGIKLLEFLSP